MKECSLVLHAKNPQRPTAFRSAPLVCVFHRISGDFNLLSFRLNRELLTRKERILSITSIGEYWFTPNPPGGKFE